MPLTKQRPIRSTIYTGAEIINVLYLLDSPALEVVIGDKRGCIQDSHMTNEQLMSVPGFAESSWKYLRTTDEEIPVFKFVGPDPHQFLDIVDAVSYSTGEVVPEELWITPKGFPRQQERRPEVGVDDL